MLLKAHIKLEIFLTSYSLWTNLPKKDVSGWPETKLREIAKFFQNLSGELTDQYDFYDA